MLLVYSSLQSASQKTPHSSFIYGSTYSTVYSHGPHNNAYYLGHVKRLYDDDNDDDNDW